MCIVIDTNTLSKVFKASDKKHLEFKPVLDWIVEGNGKIVIGGSKFHDELFTNIGWFRKLFLLLKGLNKVVVVDAHTVDAHQKAIEAKKIHKHFDDPHLVALLAISKCRVICTNDARAIPFIQNRMLYPKRAPLPSIYSQRGNANLLCDKNIAGCCMPKVKLTKKMAANIPHL
jgi:hypothetical protein